MTGSVRARAVAVGLLGALGAGAFGACAPGDPVPAREDASARPSAAGRIVDENGRPVPDAVVSFAHAASGRRFTVYADDSGAWRVRDLPAGLLSLEARGPDAEATARASRTGAAEDLGGTITLGPPRTDDEPRASDFLAQLPDGARKHRFIVDCGGCHTFSSLHARVDGGRLRTEAEWSAPIQLMLSFSGQGTGFPIISGATDAATDARWLVESLAGAGAPPGSRLPPHVRTATGARLTEYDVPEPMDLPHDVAVAPDGRILVTGMMTHRMYLLDPATGVWETEPIPADFANPRAVDVDAAGRWIVALGAPRSVAVRDVDGTWSVHPVGLYPHSVALDASGGVWVNGHFSADPEIIARLDLDDGSIERHEVPRSAGPDDRPGESTIPYGLRVDAAGIVWGTQLRGNRLVRLDPRSGDVRTWTLPTAHSGPRRPDPGPDGSIWIPLFGSGTLARFDPETERFEEIELPIPDAGPYVVRVDRVRGTVWLGTGHADLVLALDPETSAFTAYPLPTRGALVRHLDVDEATGAVWVAYGASPGIAARILRIEPA